MNNFTTAAANLSFKFNRKGRVLKLKDVTDPLIILQQNASNFEKTLLLFNNFFTFLFGMDVE